MSPIRPQGHAGSREQAIQLVSDLPGDLAAETVVLDCADLSVGTSSFADEIVKQILIDREAAVLEVSSATPRIWRRLEQASRNRGVHDRIRVMADAIPAGD